MLLGTFSCLLSEELHETGDHTTYLADTRDLLLREAKTRQLAITAAPGGTRRAVLRAVAGCSGRAGRVSVLHRAARRRVPGQGRGRALRAVVAGGGTQDVRAAAATAAAAGRRAHRTPVTSGASVGHHRCVISGVHDDPLHGTAALHRCDAIVLPASRSRPRPRRTASPLTGTPIRRCAKGRPSPSLATHFSRRKLFAGITADPWNVRMRASRDDAPIDELRFLTRNVAWGKRLDSMWIIANLLLIKSPVLIFLNVLLATV